MLDICTHVSYGWHADDAVPYYLGNYEVRGLDRDFIGVFGYIATYRDANYVWILFWAL